MGTVKGSKELQAKLMRMAEIELDKAMKKATLVVQGSAKELAPVDTGDLRGSIRTKVTETPNSSITGHIYSGLEYAPYVEFGTGTRGEASNLNDSVDVSYSPDVQGQPAQPYLYPALDNNRKIVSKILGEDLIKEIRKKATGG